MMGYVVRESVGKKSDEVAAVIYNHESCDVCQIVLYGRGSDNIIDIIEMKPSVLITKRKKATVALQRIIDSCCTFDLIAFWENKEAVLIEKGSVPWCNENPSSLRATQDSKGRRL